MDKLFLLLSKSICHVDLDTHIVDYKILLDLKKIGSVFETLFFSNKAWLSTHCLQFRLPALQSQMTHSHRS